LSAPAALHLSSPLFFNAYQSVRLLFRLFAFLSTLFLLPVLVELTISGGVFDRSIPSTCLNLNAIAFSNAGIGITQDIIILVLPFPEVIYLTMINRKKIILILMFLLGSFACLTSIIRLKYLKAFATTTDETVMYF
jgi:hypothetical protein